MTIFKKSLITLGLAVIGFTSILIITVMMFMNSLYYEVNMAGLKNTAKALMMTIGEDTLVHIFTANDSVPGNQISLPLSADEAYRLTLITVSGYVLWDSHVTEGLVNHIDRKEIASALAGMEGISRRDSVSTGMRRIYYAAPIYGNNGKILGVFRLSLSVPEFGARISPIIIPFIIFICFFIVAAFWVIVLYSRSLSGSLGRLVTIAQSSALLLSQSEDTLHVVPEFISLEKAMRAMAEELNRRFEQAKSENSRLEAILNGMSEALFAVDSSLRLHLVNPKARSLFNLGSRDINTMTLLEATHSTELVEIAKKAIYGGSPLETELIFHTGLSSYSNHANAEQYFQIFASPLHANNNHICGVVLVLQEITRLVKLERVRRDFVANVSHELRTPIQLIKGFSETLSDVVSESSIGEKDQITHFIEIIRKNAGTMENLTNDLLVLSSLENNAVNSRDMEELNIASLVSEAAAAVEYQAKRKQIEIIIDCQEDIKAKLYGSFIIQALINLIDNGIKYSPENSKIWINAFNDHGNLIFEVRDKGIGISSEHIERIFERFYRVHSNLINNAKRRGSNESDNDDESGFALNPNGAERVGGTGLGLSIVRHIALLHKGSAEVESRPSEGSVFRIKIPRQ